MQHNRVCTPPPSRERSATPSRSFAWSACAWSPPLPLVAAAGTATMTCCATTNNDCSYNDDHCDNNSNNSSSSMHRCGDGVCRMDDSTHDAPIERRLGLDADSPWLLPPHSPPPPPPSAHAARGVDGHDTPTRRCLLPSHSAQLQHDDDADCSDACMHQRLSSLRACATAATHPSPPLPLLTRDDAMRCCSFGYGNKENKNDDDTAVDDCNDNDDNSAQRRRQRVSVHAVYATSSPSYAPRLIDDDDEAQQQTPRVSCSAVTHAGDDAMLLMLHGPQASSTAAAAPSCTSATSATTTTAVTATPSAALLLYTPQVDSTRIALRRQLDAEVEATNAVWRAQRAQLLLLQQQQPSSSLFTSSSSAMTSASLCEYVQPPTTVLDGVLYVGGRPDAHTPAATTRLLQQLRALRVRHIVNCCAHECPTSARVRDAFVVHERHASDHDDYLILHHDYDAFAQIVRTAASRGEAVYAHCVAGVNRSVTLCLAYLMDHSDSNNNNNNNNNDDKGSTRRGCLGCGLSPAEAVQQLRRRGHVRLLDNVGFRHQLVDHYMQRQ